MPPPSTIARRDAQVLDAIRAVAAVRGDPAPQLSLSDLAASLSTSTDTVRRAVHRLDDAGALEVLPQYGQASRYRPHASVTDGETELGLIDEQPSLPGMMHYAGQSVRSRSVPDDHAPVAQRVTR